MAAFAAVGGLFFAGYQFRKGAQLERERLVGSYMQRLNSPEFYDHMSDSREKLSRASADEQGEAWDEFASLSWREQQRYLYVMNMFEEIATLYNDGQLSDRATRRLLADASIAYWNEVGWFVERYRHEVGDPEALDEWEEMNTRLQVPPHREWQVDGLFGKV